MKCKLQNIIILLNILIVNGNIHAQDLVIDSLKLALKNAKHDTTRILVLTELSEACEVEDILEYAEPCVKLCEKGMTLKLTASTKNFYQVNLANAFNNIGFQAEGEGQIPRALQYYQRSLIIYEKIKFKSGIANILNNMGAIYNNQGDISNALEYYHKSLKLQEEVNDTYGMAISFNNIGRIYSSLADFSKALEYNNMSLKLREEMKDEAGISNSLNNIGLVYFDQQKYFKALEYYQKSLKIREQNNYKPGIATSLINIGGIYTKQKNYSEALACYHKSLKIYEDIKDKMGIVQALNSLGFLLLEEGKLQESFDYAKKNLQISNELGYPNNIRNAARLLKSIYQKQNKFKEQLEMYELEIQMKDSINNKETKKASIKKQFQYQYEKKAAADSVKHAEEQKVKNAQLMAQGASLKQEKTQRYALYGGLALVIAFLGFVFNRFRVTQKQKIIIEDQKVLVDKAFETLHEKNKEVMDSIQYARRIQRALLTPEPYFDRELNKLNK